MTTENLTDRNTLNNATAQPAYDPMQLPPDAPKWAVNNITERQYAEVRFAHKYCNEFGHGTDGHSRLELICKLADLLDDIESGIQTFPPPSVPKPPPAPMLGSPYPQPFNDYVRAVATLLGRNTTQVYFALIGYPPGQLHSHAADYVATHLPHARAYCGALLDGAVTVIRHLDTAKRGHPAAGTNAVIENDIARAAALVTGYHTDEMLPLIRGHAPGTMLHVAAQWVSTRLHRSEDECVSILNGALAVIRVTDRDDSPMLA